MHRSSGWLLHRAADCYTKRQHRCVRVLWLCGVVCLCGVCVIVFVHLTETVKILLAHKANLHLTRYEQADVFEISALYSAIKHERHDIAKLFVEKGACVHPIPMRDPDRAHAPVAKSDTELDLSFVTTVRSPFERACDFQGFF